MSELIDIVKQQNAKIDHLTKQVEILQTMLMKNQVDTTWVKEELAADMLGLKPRQLRNKVKEAIGLFAQIDYRNTNGRNWQYRRTDILKYKELTSCNPNKKILAAVA